MNGIVLLSLHEVGGFVVSGQVSSESQQETVDRGCWTGSK